MKIIRNLKIRDKLLLLLLLLLIPLIYFVTTTIRREIKINQELKEVSLQLRESATISNFIHEFQKERARIIASSEQDSIFYIEAKLQRTRTDAARKELEDFFEENNTSFAQLALLNELGRYRSDLDQDKLDIHDFRTYSASLLSLLSDRIDENATGISNVQISREMIAFQHLIAAKVELGRIRSLLMRVIQKGGLSYTDYGLYVSRKEDFDSYLNTFYRYAAKDAVADVQDLITSKSYQEIAALFELLEDNPQANLSQYEMRTVFALFSNTVEGFKQAEDHLISLISERVAEESSKVERSMLLLSLFLLLMLGLTIYLSFFIITLISNSLSALRLAAERVRLGATDVQINVYSTDEIGSVAESFRGVVQKTIGLSRVAQAIGDGNYQVEVTPQSSEDVLSLSIRDMKDKLFQYTTESSSRSWVLGGISELNTLITGVTHIDKLSSTVISFLCEYTGSEAGILYLHDDASKLEPKASYGVNFGLEELPRFRVGKGKVGEAVVEKEIKLLDQVPESYLNIQTGLAQIEPRSIIIIPLTFANNIVGALELCTRQTYGALQQEFFKSAAERISIIIHTLQAHLQTQELLYETQNQAEELETQQEELRQLNAELKASEEELKVSQEELQEKNSELEEKAQLLEEQFEAVRTKNQALEDAREALELKMQQVETVSKYKSEFLANMSHELRTPLNSILILSRLLADNTESTLSPKQVEHAQIIHRSGGDLLKLINEILDLSKIESGQIRLEVEEINLKELKLETTFKELAETKKIDFSVTYAKELPETFATDRFRLEQILKNFLSNAFKFTEAGGQVELSIYPDSTKRNYTAEPLQGQTEVMAFSVKDTGIGIPKDKQDFIFEAFQQADSSTTRKYGGTGLGLAISRELASLLGGEIRLESKAGKGSTFTLFLPKGGVQQPVQKEPAKRQPTPMPKKTESMSQVLDGIQAREKKKEINLLIIEDDKGFSGILADFALAKNFKVQQAYEGKEGLRMAREILPDAILLDINLPDISGWEVLQQIREDKDLRHISVHVMSAYDRDVVVNYPENEEYLPKPVTLEMLNKAFSSIASASDRSIETTLIVEDNEIENKAVAELLLAHGIRTTSAYSAEEAETILAKQKIDCIILDLNLPGMKGHEWMEKIRKKKGLSEIPIIIYSGKDLSEEEEIRLKRFANTIIIKNEHSYLRLLDEVQLFLHKVNQKLPLGNDFKMKLHVPEEILRNKKVLLVDDDVRNVYSLCSLLEMQGMKIMVAYDGKEALQKLDAEPDVDLILMDVMMPEMDGIEATKQIRKNYQYKQLPIIALTAKAMKGDKEKCIAAGASDYIPKPVDTDKLLTLMRVWLYES